jgi:hypothetical protein
MAGELLFKRSARLLILPPSQAGNATTEAVEIEALRLSFKIKKDLAKAANTAEVTVYNLSAERRASLGSKGARLVLEAGYAESDDVLAVLGSVGTREQIFAGDVRLIEHKHEGPNWATKLSSGDGERALAHARFSSSFAPGTSLVEVVKGAAKSLGVGEGNLGAALGEEAIQYASGYVAHGFASLELDKVLRRAGFEWSVQDGQLQVLRPGAATQEVVVLGPESGLIGSPEMGSAEKKGGRPVLKLKSLLQPRLKPGARVEVRSRSYAGLYRILKVEHSGDTEGADWFSSLEAATL